MGLEIACNPENQRSRIRDAIEEKNGSGRGIRYKDGCPRNNGGKVGGRLKMG